MSKWTPSKCDILEVTEPVSRRPRIEARAFLTLKHHAFSIILHCPMHTPIFPPWRVGSCFSAHTQCPAVPPLYPPFPLTPTSLILYGPAPRSLSPSSPTSPLSSDFSSLFMHNSVLFCTSPLAIFLDKVTHSNCKLPKSSGLTQLPGCLTVL